MPDSILQRPFGKTGVSISALGLGGHHLGDAATYEVAEYLVHAAIDGGVTFFDNCWEYHNGRSEDWMGRALSGKRDQIFLMTKVCTHGRGKELALKMLDQSLRRLQTDHLDLWQLHGMGFDRDPELALRAGGAVEAAEEARKAGKVRFIGFTGHKSPEVHLRLVQSGRFDSVQMPLNAFDAQYHSFEQKVLPEAAQRGMAVLGMKPMNGGGEAIKHGILTAEEALRYAMSLPGVTTTIAGIDKPEVLLQDLKIAQQFKPMSPDELQALRSKCAEAAADGRFELYKSSLKFDNPQARMAHGFPLDRVSKETAEALNEVEGKEAKH